MAPLLRPLQDFAQWYPGCIVTGVAATFLLVKLAEGVWSVLRPFFSPLRKLPGPPKNPSLFTGHTQELAKAEDHALLAAWLEQYGPAFAMRGMFGVRHQSQC